MAAEDNIDPRDLDDTNSGDLIVELAKRAKGVGSRKANALAEFLVNDWDAFLQSDKAEISSLKNSQGKQVFNNEQIDEILREKSEFVQFKDVRSAWIYCIGKDFLASQISMLNTITLIGRKLWDFISEVQDFHLTLFQILDISSKSITARSFSEYLDEQLKTLEREWESDFQDKSIDEALEFYI